MIFQNINMRCFFVAFKSYFIALILKLSVPAQPEIFLELFSQKFNIQDIEEVLLFMLISIIER